MRYADSTNISMTKGIFKLLKAIRKQQFQSNPYNFFTLVLRKNDFGHFKRSIFLYDEKKDYKDYHYLNSIPIIVFTIYLTLSISLKDYDSIISEARRHVVESWDVLMTVPPTITYPCLCVQARVRWMSASESTPDLIQPRENLQRWTDIQFRE